MKLLGRMHLDSSLQYPLGFGEAHHSFGGYHPPPPLPHLSQGKGELIPQVVECEVPGILAYPSLLPPRSYGGGSDLDSHVMILGVTDFSGGSLVRGQRSGTHDFRI